MLDPLKQLAPLRGAGESGELLATKLFAPRPRPDFVLRARLVQKLDEALTRDLILVSAPAGSGKTALLAEWALRRRVAWLSLDAADNDPVRFWRHAIAALDRVRPTIAERILPLLGSPPPASLEGLVTVLINELATKSDQSEVVLVLDDYHVIESPAIHASVTFLIEHRPPTLHLVLAGRADPRLPLARLRARGQLAELRTSDLRFTRQEAAALLRGSLDSDVVLTDASVAALAARTEGWAAGLQLAALSLRGRADVPAFVDSFSGGNRFILDYLAEEVLERQPEPVRTFLLETSILEQLSGPLCDAVTGRSGGTAMLEAIELANLFLVPLDEVRGWWRYHHLFADLLRARLQRQRPDRIAELHRNAAGWYERNGMPDDAVRHALAAGDAPWAARNIERNIDALLLRSERTTLERWLAALPNEIVASRPRLLLAQADLALSDGRLEAGERALDAAERVYSAAPGSPYDPSVDAGASLVANVPAAIAFWRAFLAELGDDTERALDFDHRALAELGEGASVLGSIVRLHLHGIELLRGVQPKTERDFAASMAELSAAGEIYPALRACELLGRVQRAQGRLDAARETYRQGLDIAAPPGRHPLPAAWASYIGLAEVAYQRGELECALKHASQGIGLCRQLTYARPLAAGLAILARIRQAEGDLSGALDVLSEYRPGAPTVGALVSGAGRSQGYRLAHPPRGIPALLDPVPALRARLLAASGDLAAAVRWVQERGLDDGDEVSYSLEQEYLVLARVFLAQSQPARAVALLDRLLALATAEGRTGDVIEIQALRAVALAAAGNQTGAVATLAETLALAFPEGYVRVFADEGPPMSALLGQVVAAQRRDQTATGGVPLGYVGRLLRAFDQGEHRGESGSKRRGVGVPGLVETLSERELEVLQLLAAGKPNREIADELFVSVDTVKKHVTHILEKLGASNRTQATARARELRLLADVDDPPTTAGS